MRFAKARTTSEYEIENGGFSLEELLNVFKESYRVVIFLDKSRLDVEFR